LLGLSNCTNYGYFERVFYRQIDRSRDSKWCWIYNDNSSRVKIESTNFIEGLEDEKQNRCFIYISYHKDSPPLTLTKENLLRITRLGPLPTFKLESSKSSSKASPWCLQHLQIHSPTSLEYKEVCEFLETLDIFDKFSD
jgi:hypothetical protein